MIVVVSRVPLLCEALSDALAEIAEVRGFPAGRGGTEGLLRCLTPDAVVVDSEIEAEAAVAFARSSGAPAVHVSFEDEKLRILRDGRWEEPEDGDASPEGIRNILVGSIFREARRKVVQT